MDQAMQSDRLTEKHMLRILYMELQALRRQNEDQQRELKHLRHDMRTAMLLGRPDNALQASTTTPFKRFKEFPLEIREMIWEHAVPSRLLRFINAAKEGVVPSALPVPAVAHVCQESRRVVLARTRVKTLSGRSHHFGGPSQLWRLQHSQMGASYWTWFTPYRDVLLIDTDPFPEVARKRNHHMLQVAEHVVIEDRGIWADFLQPPGDRQEDEGGSGEEDDDGDSEEDDDGDSEEDEDGDSEEDEDGERDEDEGDRLGRLVFWWRDVMPEPEYPPPPGGPSWNLRTIDFAMTSVTKINENYPPNFVHRLFAGESVRIVDLRDRGAVRGIEKMLDDEMSQFGPPKEFDLWRMGLQTSQEIFKAANAPLFKVVRASLLKEMARLYHASSFLDPKKRRPTLPSPFNSKSKSKLDRKVPWVKEFTERLNIRPVHVFVRVNGKSDEPW